MGFDNAQQSEKKLQSVGNSVVKATTIISKVVNKMALQESEGDTSVGEYIDSCNDALALLGHSNRQMNMTRRDLIKPDLSYDYLHLCAQFFAIYRHVSITNFCKTKKEW